uniref:Uncharacterized protein n=1 Tax=Strigamia maritima TaxID=126957 RepID=T1IN59_STRMM
NVLINYINTDSKTEYGSNKYTEMCKLHFKLQSCTKTLKLKPKILTILNNSKNIFQILSLKRKSNEFELKNSKIYKAKLLFDKVKTIRARKNPKI